MLFPNQHEIAFLILLAVTAIFLLSFVVPILGSLWWEHWWLSALMFLLCLVLMEWRVLLLLALLLVSTFILAAIVDFRRRSYAKQYPVFTSEPKLLARSTSGQDYRLHIEKGKFGFIIGISFEEEIDSIPRVTTTRWKVTFPTYELAEMEVIKRCKEMAERHGTPNPSIERTCPGKPDQASHIKR